MVTQVISFRFTEQEIDLLRQRAQTHDESTSAIAQRLLRDILGLSTEVFTTVDSLEERIEKVALLIVDKRIQECLQQYTVTMLGE
ncbi:MAG: hypothetical protein H0U45_17115 [Tatlockia sp.]|nr:hypothetical protein [Tatlockia sp.]